MDNEVIVVAQYFAKRNVNLCKFLQTHLDWFNNEISEDSGLSKSQKEVFRSLIARIQKLQEPISSRLGPALLEYLQKMELSGTKIQ